jgi:hypothetical protein
MHPCQQLKNLYTDFLARHDEFRTFFASELRKTDRKKFIKNGREMMEKIAKENFIRGIRKVFKNFFGNEKLIKVRLAVIQKRLGFDLPLKTSGDIVSWGGSAQIGRLENFRQIIQQICKIISHPDSPIHALDLSYEYIMAEDMENLASALEHPHNRITNLFLAGNAISDTGAIRLAKAFTNSNNKISLITLDYNKITRIGAKALAESFKSPNNKVYELNLSNNSFTNDDFKIFAELIKTGPPRLAILALTGMFPEPHKTLFKNQLAGYNSETEVLL